jgi:ferric-dicitrate binding protein FerR (iron transport regulator)
MPQPLDSPMKIRTPSANLSVLGTQFSVRSERALTRLSVESGGVLMTRSSDSREIEVAENRQALARIDEVGEWVASPLEVGNPSWQANSAEARLEDKWLSSYRNP